MKQFILVCAIVLTTALPGPADAQAQSEKAIQSVIASQFDAFLDDDLASAWDFASPTIRQIFRTPENFGMMVRNGYPMVWRPSETRFLELRDIEGVLWQKVQIRDTAGKYHLLDYKMVETEAGWLIDGVQFIRSVGVGV